MASIDENLLRMCDNMTRNTTAQEITEAINAGADVNAKDENGRTSLMWASRNQGIEAVYALLDAGANVNAKAWEGDTALMWAVYNKDPNVVPLLLKAGADVNAKDKDDMTALILAAWHSKNPDIIKALIEAGADVNAKIENGENFNLRENAMALKDDVLNTKMVLFSIVEKILDDMRYMNWCGDTALMKAVMFKKIPAVVEALLNAGADVNAKTKNGTTVLMMATLFNAKTEIIYALLDAGADINARTDKGITALDFARKSGNATVIKRLEDAMEKAQADEN